MAVTIVLGLASRRYAAFLPSWLAKNAGDALYATMIFWGIGLLLPRASTRTVALLAMAFCFVIEASQLCHVAGLDAIRATRLGALILGSGFHALDLLCYVVGAALGAALELAARRARSREEAVSEQSGD